MAVPLDRTLGQLAGLAAIRGDAAESALFLEAAALVRSSGVTAESQLSRLLHSLPPEANPELIRRLRFIDDAGAWVLLESAIADLPSDLRWLFESGAVTVEQVLALHRHLGATCSADLAAAVRRSAAREVPGLDARVESAIAAALPTLRAAVPRIPLGRAVALAEPVLEALRAVPRVGWALPAGSLRRAQDSVGDIEIVASSDDAGGALDAVAPLAAGGRLLLRNERRLYFVVDRVQIGVRCVPPAQAGAVLLHLTGTAAHLAALDDMAGERGWSLDDRGLARAAGAPRIASSEAEIYAALDLPLIPPEIRDGGEELRAARAGALPRLVSREDIRGDLHMHTTWSDGRDTMADMVAACVALGYEYVAITDHSPHSGATRNLTADGVLRQADEIAALRETYPRIAILHGCEVDIMPDGRLDFPDHILERLDIVLASLHQQAGHGPDRLLRRYLAAMHHPLVSVITHPTNRVVPHRQGYDLDYDRLFAAAVDTGTAVEIDGAPSHLDLDGALARRAIAAGATVVIDSDCHRVDTLGRQMALGISTARRGWVEPRHVLNARPLADLRGVVAAKRGR